MREIKFRGKCIPEFPHPVAKWVYGSFVSDELILSPYKERNENRHFWYMVDPATVGQFTGLRDSDGREIYEGDVVSVIDEGDETRHEVRYMSDVGYPAFDLVPETTGWCCETSQFMLYCMLDMGLGVRVIGNIHDNPYLLEKRP